MVKFQDKLSFMCEMLKNQQDECSHRKTIQKQRSVAKTYCNLSLKLKVHLGFHSYTRVNQVIIMVCAAIFLIYICAYAFALISLSQGGNTVAHN